YSKDELKAINDASKAEVTYTDKLGNVHTCTAYEATQLQRRQETTIRRLKDIQYAYEQAGDTVMAKEYAKKITKQRNYYKSMSAEVGLKPKMERTRIIKAKAEKEQTNVAKFVAKNKNNVNIVFDEKLNKPRWSESKRIILNLSNEYNTRLNFVTVG